jgi:hypothetical protein
MAPIMLHRAAPHILQIDEKFAEPDCRSNLEFLQAQDAFLIMQTGLHSKPADGIDRYRTVLAEYANVYRHVAYLGSARPGKPPRQAVLERLLSAFMACHRPSTASNTGLGRCAVD